MAITTATVVAAGAAAASAGVSYAGYASNKKAQEESAAAAEQAYGAQAGLLEGLPSGEELGLEEILAGIQPYEPFDVMKFGRSAARQNLRFGLPKAYQAADEMAADITAKSNAQAVADVETAMAQLFGGAEQLNAQRTSINDQLGQSGKLAQTWMSGQLSDSAKQQLNRAALAAGSNLGEGAVDDLYAGYLGLSTEDLAYKGAELAQANTSSYQSLYSMYRQAAPITTRADVMSLTLPQTIPLTTISPADAIQAEMYNRLNAAKASLGAADLGLDAAEASYTADLNKALGLTGILSNQAGTASQNSALTAMNNNQLVQGISSSLGSLAGLAMTSSKASVNTTNAGAAGNFGSTYTGSYMGQPVYKPATVS